MFNPKCSTRDKIIKIALVSIFQYHLGEMLLSCLLFIYFWKLVLSPHNLLSFVLHLSYWHGPSAVTQAGWKGGKRGRAQKPVLGFIYSLICDYVFALLSKDSSSAIESLGIVRVLKSLKEGHPILISSYHVYFLFFIFFFFLIF